MICPHCGAMLDTAILESYSLRGAIVTGSIRCGGCGERIALQPRASTARVPGTASKPELSGASQGIAGFFAGAGRLVGFLAPRGEAGWPQRLPRNRLIRGLGVSIIGLGILVGAYWIAYALHPHVPEDGPLRLLMVITILPTILYAAWTTIIGVGLTFGLEMPMPQSVPPRR